MVFASPSVRSGMKNMPTFYALKATAEEEQFITMACTGLIGVLFGGIHCVGWAYFLPSHAEVIIWRVSSVAIIAVLDRDYSHWALLLFMPKENPETKW